MEFVIFTEIFQRSRTHTGSAGLGGNGQFARLAALRRPGPRSVVRLPHRGPRPRAAAVVDGWQTTFCPRTWVDQQAVTDMRRLLRQRTRWYQGHLQCWSRLPAAGEVRPQLAGGRRPGLPPDGVGRHAAHGPLLGDGPRGHRGRRAGRTRASSARSSPRHYGLPILVWYVAAFGLSWFYAWLYWMATPSMSFSQGGRLRPPLRGVHLHLAHLGVRGDRRMITRKQGWAKTARTKDVALSAHDPKVSVARPRRSAAAIVAPVSVTGGRGTRRGLRRSGHHPDPLRHHRRVRSPGRAVRHHDRQPGLPVRGVAGRTGRRLPGRRPGVRRRRHLHRVHLRRADRRTPSSTMSPPARRR